MKLKKLLFRWVAQVALSLLAGGFFSSAQAAKKPEPLLVFCAAGIRQPVEAAAQAYEKEYGIPIHLQYGGTGTLLSSLKAAGAGDLFIPAEESYVVSGRQAGLIKESIPLATLRPVIAVKKGNPKGIRNLADLLRGDVAFGMANPDAAASGKIAKEILVETGQWAEFEKKAKVFKPTVNDIANDIKIGAIDAGVVWDATARQYPDLEIVELPGAERDADLCPCACADAASGKKADQLFVASRDTVSACVLSSSKQPTEALRFARYLGAKDKGLPLFEKYHFTPERGDVWAKVPDLKLFSGAMLRPGLEETLKAFQEREGCTITTVYNGCGILTAQMKAGQRPDAYFSCDTTFMDTVADLYADNENIVDNFLMILVPKGNPKGIKTPQDLLAPGVRLGLPHHEKSAMGNVAWKMLKDMGIYDALQENMKVESPTGDLLVNQLRTGSLDAIIACRSNLSGVSEHLDGVPIDHRLANMTQPYAVGKDSANRRLAERLHEAILTEESKQRFEKAGFRWKAN